MGLPAPFDGRRYLIDKSAAARSGHPLVRDAWARAVRAGQLVVAPIFLLEALYSARSAGEFAALEEELAALPSARAPEGLWRIALDAMRELAAVQSGWHRVKIPDLLIAAIAQESALGVLHYDGHYDRLASVLRFESRWIAPPGSLERV